MAAEKLIEKPNLKSPEGGQGLEKGKREFPDQGFEKPSSATEKIAEPYQAKGSRSALPHTVIPPSNTEKERSKAIDAILAEGLDEVFLKLTPEKQKEFKLKGEETVRKINGLLNHTKVKVKKIISLIKAWLKVIPGINKFFLEQESKIKADKILETKNKF